MEFGASVDQPVDAKATAGTVKDVLHDMSSHVADGKVQIRGMRSLEMFLEFGLSQQLLVCRAGGHECIVSAMKAHSSNAELQCHGALALTYLAQGCPEAQTAAITAGAVEVLLSAMRNFSEAEELQASSAVALATLMQQSSAGAERVGRAGGAEVLVELLRRPLSEDADGVALQRGCECLAVLISASESALRAPWYDVAEAVTGAMLLLPAQAEVQVAGCWALEEAARKGTADSSSAICEAGGLSAVVTAMKRPRCGTAVLDGGCKALGAVAAARRVQPVNPTAPEALVGEVVEAVVVACTAAIARRAKSPKGAARSLKLACVALGAWAGLSTECALEVAKAGGAKALVQVMKLQPEGICEQDPCLLALRQIACCEAGRRAVLQAGYSDIEQQLASKGLCLDLNAE